MRLKQLSFPACIYIFLVFAEISYAQTSHEIPEQYRDTPTIEQPAMLMGVSPKMPRWARRSGYCCMKMDVDEYGNPANVDASYCSDDIFALSSVLATKQWKFQTLIIDGKPVSWKNIMKLQTFVLADYDGKIIPDRNGLLSADPQNDPNSIEELCYGQPTS